MKKTLIFLGAAAVLTLTGCSAESVIQDEDTSMYSQLAAEGRLNENGYYISETYEVEYAAPGTSETAEETLVAPGGEVHISLARNGYINTDYTLIDHITGEESHIDGSEFYAQPGDIVRVQWTEENPVSSMYKLDSINMYEYIKQSRRLASVDIAYDSKAETAEITVPGSGDYSIEPVGKYIDRTLTMRAVIEGTATESGSWTAYIKTDDSTYTPCDPSKMDPTKDYKLTYNYAYNDYYVSGCTPDDSNVYREDSKGEMTFGPYSASSDVSSFEVTLHSYLRCRVQGDINAVTSFIVDGTDKTSELKGNKVSAFLPWEAKYYYLDKMMTKSRVTVDVASGYELDYTELAAPMDKQALGDGSTRYTFEIAESDTNIALLYVHKPGRDSAIEYIEQSRDEAKISVQFSDEDNLHVPKTGEMINPNQHVTVTITPKTGYYITDENKNSFETEFRSFARELDKHIESYIRKIVNIEFSTEDSDGKLEFLIDEKQISGNTFEAKQGQVIKFIYTVNDSQNYQIECRNELLNRYRDSFSYTFEVTPDLEGKLIDIGFLEQKFNFSVVKK